MENCKTQNSTYFVSDKSVMGRLQKGLVVWFFSQIAEFSLARVIFVLNFQQNVKKIIKDFKFAVAS